MAVIATRRAFVNRQPSRVAGTSGDVDGVLLENSERDDLECPHMSGCEHHVRGSAVFVCQQPVGCGHAPPIAGHEAREAKLRHRSAEIVADATLVLEELSGDHRADRVAAPILGSSPTAPVPVEAGKRVRAAGLQLAAQHISVNHGGVAPNRPGVQGLEGQVTRALVLHLLGMSARHGR